MGWSAFRPNGLTHHNPNLSVKGFTLITPVGMPDVYLLDMRGQVVMHWLFDDIDVSLPTFLPNGNLMVSAVTHAAQARANALADDDYTDLDARRLKLGGGYDTLREYDWDGNLIWQYDNPHMHHDYYPFDNGDVLIPAWVVLPKEVAGTVQGGYRNHPRPPVMFGDDLIRVNRAGEIVDRWHTWQMLDPVDDPIGPLQSGLEWTHMNSVHVMPDGQFICSLCENSRVVRIDPVQRIITWKLGDPTISMQHHATPVGDGNVQIFDNGRKRPLSIPYSQVIEVDPRTDDIVWRYKPANVEQFYSGHISSAQRLAGDNVLICEGAVGRLFEVTRQGEIVWEWMNPFVGGGPERKFQWLYRAYRYPLDHAAFRGRALHSAEFHNINRAYGLDTAR